MRTRHIPLVLAVTATISGCALLTPSGSPRRVSPHYTAVGSVEDARAYIYGGRTILEFGDTPLFLSIKDENGDSVDYDKEGRYYRLERQYNTLTALVNGRTVKFTAAAPTTQQTRVYSSPLAAKTSLVQQKPKITNEPVKLQANYDADIAALIALSKRQLEEIHQALPAHGTQAAYNDFKTRLDDIERRLKALETATVQVTFQRYSTKFKPNLMEAWALENIPKDKASVTITGYTDSWVAGPKDAKIAHGRAIAARDYLVDIGIKPDKIKVFSQAEGEFIVPNNTKQGRALNRRVEIAIDLVNRLRT